MIPTRTMNTTTKCIHDCVPRSNQIFGSQTFEQNGGKFGQNAENSGNSGENLGKKWRGEKRDVRNKNRENSLEKKGK